MTEQIQNKAVEKNLNIDEHVLKIEFDDQQEPT